MDITEMQAWLYLGVLNKNQILMGAIDLLKKDVDTPTLRELAGLNKDVEEEEIKKLLFKIFSEMNLVPLDNKKAAGLTLAKKIALNILNGSVDPYKGAKEIWNIWNISERPKELIGFINDADDYEDSHRGDPKILEDICQQAKLLTSSL